MTTAQTTPMLIDANEAARMCGMSRSAWYKLVSTGKAPRSMKLGALARWRRNELEDWVTAGCPPREKWDAMNTAG